MATLIGDWTTQDDGGAAPSAQTSAGDAPNRSLQELHDAAMDGEKLDTLAQFADACRKELGRLAA